MKRFLQKNGLLVLFVATVAALTLSVVNFFSTNTSPLSNLVNTILTPVRSGYTAVADWVDYQRAHFTDVHELEERIKELEVELAETERKLRQAEADSEENKLLRELLNLRPSRETSPMNPPRSSSRAVPTGNPPSRSTAAAITVWSRATASSPPRATLWASSPSSAATGARC